MNKNISTIEVSDYDVGTIENEIKKYLSNK